MDYSMSTYKHPYAFQISVNDEGKSFLVTLVFKVEPLILFAWQSDGAVIQCSTIYVVSIHLSV